MMRGETIICGVITRKGTSCRKIPMKNGRYLIHNFEVDGKKKYIIEHRDDKFGRGPHFHGADDLKGSPLEKGRYNQY